MADETEMTYSAITEFVGTFPTLTGAPPSDITELGDGVALFEAMSEMYVRLNAREKSCLRERGGL